MTIYEQVAHHGKLLFLVTSGSKLYGTDTPTSDTDYKGVFLPSENSLILKDSKEFLNLDSNKTNSKNSVQDTDCHIDSLHKWFSLLAKGETNALDTLFALWTDKVVYEEPSVTNWLRENYLQLITSNPHAFVGYCISQATRYNVKGKRYTELLELLALLKEFSNQRVKLEEIQEALASKIESFKYIKFVEGLPPRGAKAEYWIYLSVLGKKFSITNTLEYLIERLELIERSYGHRVKTTSDVDWKAVSHAVRVILEVEELLVNNFIVFPLKDRGSIKEVKAGLVDLEEVMELLASKIDVVDSLLLSTTLKPSVNKELQEEFILSLYSK